MNTNTENAEKKEVPVKCIHVRNAKNVPVGTIAYKLEDGVIKYGTATHHPKKDVLDLERGCSVAKGRLRKCPQKVDSPFVDDGRANDYFMTQLILACVQKDHVMPGRLRKHARTTARALRAAARSVPRKIVEVTAQVRTAKLSQKVPDALTPTADVTPASTAEMRSAMVP